MSVYLGIFLIAFSTLALEVLLARLLSVTTWYHLAFFAISTAMLGMTAGATTVYLHAARFRGDRREQVLAAACVAYGLVVPVSLIVLCLLPLQLTRSVMSVFALLIITVVCAIPFYWSGVVIAAVLTTPGAPVGRLYATDLLGASLGCVFVLGGLEVVDAPSLVLLCAALGFLAAAAFAAAGSSWRRATLVGGLLVVIASAFNTTTVRGIRPQVVKGSFESLDEVLVERWNSYSRVVVYRSHKGPPQLWGPSPVAPSETRLQYWMKIDGAASTVLREFRTLDDISHLRYDVTNMAYAVRSPGPVCVIGVGGGRDVQSAILFGYGPITGIEVNPIFVELLAGDFRTFAGIANRRDVRVIVDEARSALSRTTERFAIIQMSLVDTWASTAAGAYSLSENALYTTEAWQVFFRRLSDDGLFTVSRYFSPRNLGETGRVVSLAVATLLAEGVSNPSEHLAMATAGNVSTLLVARRPFGADELARLDQVARELRFDVPLRPGTPPEHPELRGIVQARSGEQLAAAIGDAPLNYRPSTDDNPYFFNMLRLGHLRQALSADPGVIRGNVIASGTLLVLIGALTILTLITVVVPLAAGSRRSEVLWPGAAYFAAVGAGFMFIEIGLMQRLSVFLGHPMYALGVLLTAIIGSTGVGSALSESLLLERSRLLALSLATTGAILVVAFVSKVMTGSLETASVPMRIVVAIGVIAPLGVLMGHFVPAGLRLTRGARQAETPWYWALNGISGVLCSAVAVFVAIHWGIAVNFYLGAVCYAATLPCLLFLERARRRAQGPASLPVSVGGGVPSVEL